MQENANKVRDELPDGWQVLVSMERDALSVSLIDPDGEFDEYGDFLSGGDTIESAILHALETAVALDPGFYEGEEEEE